MKTIDLIYQAKHINGTGWIILAFSVVIIAIFAIDYWTDFLAERKKHDNPDRISEN